MEIRLSTPGPAVSKSTAGRESVVARMMVLRILAGGSSRETGWLRAVGALVLFLWGAVVEAHDARADGGEAGAGDDKGVAVEGIEALGDIAGKLDVLALVVAD